MKITVRFVEDFDTEKMWFEEKLDNGQWVKIESTEMSCVGNSRHELAKEIESRRQRHLSIMRKYGEEETFTL